jgi:formate dehydrogenase major subunit
VPGLGTSFGRGGATTAQQDLANADAILIMGSSMAENHPVGFQWVMEARERGATIIHVDPRFSRTSAMADIWLPLRPGSDIAFLGALINYVLQNNKEFRDYIVPYTNASFLLREDFKDTEDLGGLFSGWDEQAKKYDPKTWLYYDEPKKASGATGHSEASGGHGQDRGGEAGDPAKYDSDPTLEHPRCVFQVLKRHFARYTPEMVERACGISAEDFLRAAEIFTSASGPEKTAAICYSVGWTQHSNGPQIIRAAAILQLLLGNMGRPGGGILALRGHASIQGSTDIPTLYDILPGYLPMPSIDDAHSFQEFVKKHRSRTGVWSSFENYYTSLLKAYYGEAATRENNWGFGWLPRMTGDHSHFGYFVEMMDGKVEGLFVMGQNPAVGAPNGRFHRKALSKLKWLVVREMVETETASFWNDSPEVRRGELDPEKIGTEVFLFPAAGSAEKEGCYTNTQRLLQFREKAVEPPGEATSDLWFMYHLGRRLKAKAATDRSAKNAPLNALTWDYPTHGSKAEPSAEDVLKEINGYVVGKKRQVESYKDLKRDGSTACGCWIYSGVMPRPDLNRAHQREPQDALGHGWGFSWPNDCRILYNRASARPDGKPWSARKALIWWDEEKREWTGHDRPDIDQKKPPYHKGDLEHGEGTDALGGDKPFVLHPDGVGWLFVSSGLKDGPLPAHYEPLESVVKNPLYPSRQTDPAAAKMERPGNPYAREVDDERFPYVLTTYRLTEHHTAGGMSRRLSHLAELQPEAFCEISPELAEEVGIEPGSWVTLSSPRGITSVRALVTTRMRRLWIDGKSVHVVGLPYHFGWKGLAKGDVANDLLAISEEPNVRIMETKALVCNLSPGRRTADDDGALDEYTREQRRIA